MPSLDSAALPIVMVLHRGRFVSVCRTAEDFSTASSGAFRTDCFTPPYVAVDANLTRYELKAVRKVAPAGPLWGLSLMHGRRFRVEHIVASAAPTSLDELKALVCRAVQNNLNRWDSAIGIEVGDVIQEVNDARTFDGVLSALEPDP